MVKCLNCGHPKFVHITPGVCDGAHECECMGWQDGRASKRVKVEMSKEPEHKPDPATP